MENKDRIFDLKEYIRYVIHRFFIVLIAAVLFCGLFMVSKYKSQKKELADNGTSIQSIITQNHDAFFLGNVKYTDAVKPEGTYNSAAVLYVDFNYNDVEGSDRFDFYQLNNKYETDACSFLASEKILGQVIDELKLKDEEDMKDLTAQDLKWMVNKNFAGAHTMNIVVTDVNSERSQKIANAVIDIFVKALPDYLGVDAVEVIDAPSLPKKGVTELKSVDKAAVIKKGIIGGILGGALAAFVLLIVFIATDKVRSNKELEYVGYTLLTELKKKDIKQSDCERILSILSLNNDKGKVVIADIDGHFDSSGLVDQIKPIAESMHKDIDVSGSKSGMNYMDAVSLLEQGDDLILTVSANKTKVEELVKSKELFDRLQVNTLGVILVR